MMQALNLQAHQRHFSKHMKRSSQNLTAPLPLLTQLWRSSVCSHAPIQRGNLPYHRRERRLGGSLNLPPADPIGDDIVRAEHGIEGGTAKQAMCSFYNPAPPPLV